MKLLIFAVGFLIFCAAIFYMFSEPYTKTIIVRGEPYDMTLYRGFYAGLSYWLVGVLIMFSSFVYEEVRSIVFRSN